MRARASGATVGEEPIRFVDRIYGDSKLGGGEIGGYSVGWWGVGVLVRGVRYNKWISQAQLPLSIPPLQQLGGGFWAF